MTTAALLELAVAAAPSGVFVFDEQGAILFTNPTFDRMFGQTAEDVQGTSVEALAAGALESSRSDLAPPQNEQPSNPMASSLLLRGRRQDGTEFPIEVRLVRTIYRGQPVTLGSVVDATDRQMLHEELVNRNAFEQAVAEIAAGFLDVSEGPVNEWIVASQRRLSTLLGIERSAWWQRDGDDFRVFRRVAERLLVVVGAAPHPFHVCRRALPLGGGTPEGGRRSCRSSAWRTSRRRRIARTAGASVRGPGLPSR